MTHWPKDTEARFGDFITKQFNVYKIQGPDKVIDCSKKEKEETCGEKSFEIQPHQKIVSDLISDKTPYRGLLVYHEVGSGKTLSAVIACERSTKKVVILAPSKIIMVWLEHIVKYACDKYDITFDQLKNMRKDSKIRNKIKKSVSNKYSFVTSNANNTIEQLKKQLPLDNKIIIIDEAHEIARLIANREHGKELMNLITFADNAKVLMLSGTPAIGDPYQLAILFTMLRGNIGPKNKKQTIVPLFPSDYDQFREYFVNNESKQIKNKNIFQERINGLVTFYKSIGTESAFPKQDGPSVKYIPMSAYQWTVYRKFRDEELTEERKRQHAKKIREKTEFGIPGRQTASSYKIKSRQALNFVLPNKDTSGKEIFYPTKQELKQALQLAKKEKKDLFLQDTQSRAEIWDSLFSRIPKKELEFESIGQYSPKIKYILDYTKKTPKGIIVIYSSFLTFGVEILSKVLLVNGYEQFTGKKSLKEIVAGHDKTTNKTTDKTVIESKSKKANPQKFAILSGESTEEQMNNIFDSVNSPDNKYGDLIKILLISKAFSEGETINNVHTLFIFEGQWQYYIIQQVIGRAVRMCTHYLLPPEERIVHIFVLLCYAKGIDVRKVLGEKVENPNATTDTVMYEDSLLKQKLIDSFLLAMKEVAIDCEILSAHNFEPDGNNQTALKHCVKCVDPESNEPVYYPNIEEHFNRRQINKGSFCIRRVVIDTLIGPIIENNLLYVYDDLTKDVYLITDISYIGRYNKKFHKIDKVPPNFPKEIPKEILKKSPKKIPKESPEEGTKEGKKEGTKEGTKEGQKEKTIVYDPINELLGVIKTYQFPKDGILYHPVSLNAYRILPKIVYVGYYNTKKIVFKKDYKPNYDYPLYRNLHKKNK